MIYFTSDLHFYHANVIKHAKRPFSTVEEMNAVLISNWNKVVQESDEVYILGDVTMKGASFAAEVLRQLNGRKYLIKGNHDRFADQQSFDCGLFEWIKDYYELTYQNQRFILLHYPIAEWNHFYHSAIHLHGHQHNYSDYNLQNRQNGLRRFDVGVDANDMRPVSIDKVIDFFNITNNSFLF